MSLMFYLVSQFSACLVPTLVAFQTPHYFYHGKTFYMFIRIDTIKISFFPSKNVGTCTNCWCKLRNAPPRKCCIICSVNWTQNHSAPMLFIQGAVPHLNINDGLLLFWWIFGWATSFHLTWLSHCIFS